MVMPKPLSISHGNYEVGINDVEYTTSWSDILKPYFGFPPAKKIKEWVFRRMKLRKPTRRLSTKYDNL